MEKLFITRIDIYKLNVRMTTPFEISLGVMSETESMLIRITASNGVYGFGEGAPVSFITGETQETAYKAAQPMARLLIGKDPLAIETRMAELDRFLTNNTSTKSCFDVALYDILAKQAGLPLYALLGGEKRVLETDLTIGINSPEVMAKEALEIKANGFPAIKVKLGTNRRDDLARIRAIREAIGPELPIRVDANQGWDPVTARLILNDLAPYGIQYAEEPLPHWNSEALRRVRQTSPIPVMADETIFDHHDAFRLASMGACDYFNIKLAKCGGIHKALKINAVAEAAGIKCMLGCMLETRLGLGAAAHLVSAQPNITFVDLDSALDLAEDPVIGGMNYDGHRILLPDTPGHGADIDPDFLKSLECVSVTG